MSQIFPAAFTPKKLAQDVDAIVDFLTQNAPYLANLASTRHNIAAQIGAGDIDGPINKAFADLAAAAQMDWASATTHMRQTKADIHFALAMADLSGQMDQAQVTGILSGFADLAIKIAVQLAADNLRANDRAVLNLTQTGQLPKGLFIIGMGKLGAMELNYSSDIDLIAILDRQFFSPQIDSLGAAVRLVGAATRMLDDVNGAGYVFRTDWRLRPDPASSALVVPLAAAEHYYESVGQNWERAAFIKARFIAGDEQAGTGFLKWLEPFIWRKHLDFAAIDDIKSILQQIHSHNKSVGLSSPFFDVKLGRGGIREIEFFVQTQQLILGGRTKQLRNRGTLASLAQLVEAGRIDEDSASSLAIAYNQWRTVEHRIQMTFDAHSHLLAEDGAKREAIAKLCGMDDLPAFDGCTTQTRQQVSAIVGQLFSHSPSLGSHEGALVFTGVDDDPATLASLKQMGFANPPEIAARFREWHRGKIAAMRSPRARELLTRLTPALFSALADTGDADASFARFDRFLSSLSAGVQILALLDAEPAILANLVATLGLSDSLAQTLAKTPALLDSMLLPRFGHHAGEDDIGQILANELAQIDVRDQANLGGINFEAKLDAMRITHREAQFRTGYHLLHQHISAQQAAKQFSQLAEAMIGAALPLAKAEITRRYGGLNGQVQICAWGTLAGGQMCMGSDLDVMVVYQCAEGVNESDGPKSLSAQAWYARTTQSLLAILSTPTAEGSPYQVDMQLRPSGNAGPVAVQLASFIDYYHAQAWVWELQALTRLRPLAGDEPLAGDILANAKAILAKPKPVAPILTEIGSMRQKMATHLAPRGPFDIKRLKGGLIDLEFLVQGKILTHLAKGGKIENGGILPNVSKALSALADCGALAPEMAGRLNSAYQFMETIRQIMAVLGPVSTNIAQARTPVQNILAQGLDLPDFARVQAELADHLSFVRGGFEDFFAAG